jgi:hypothetical protein
MLLQLNPPIPVYMPGRGSGLAVLIIDYGPDYDLLWTVIDDQSGQIWTLNNKHIRGVKNITMGRPPAEPACTCPPVGLSPDCSSR